MGAVTRRARICARREHGHRRRRGRDTQHDHTRQECRRPAAGYCRHDGTSAEPWLILAPEHAELLKDAGLDKAQVKRRLWQQSKMAAGRMAGADLERTQAARTSELGAIGPETLLPISPQPEGIGIIVAGGAGTHSVCIPTF